VARISAVNNMSPAERLEANKRIKNIKHRKQTRFRTSLIDAEVHQVDFESEVFGVDVDGNVLDLDDMFFIRVDDYPDGSALVENEVGAFYSEKELKPPIRIVGIISENEG